ncbi:hypothetical protein B296_00034890, partial [Ensete ventricosum]
MSYHTAWYGRSVHIVPIADRYIDTVWYRPLSGGIAKIDFYRQSRPLAVNFGRQRSIKGEKGKKKREKRKKKKRGRRKKYLAPSSAARRPARGSP